MWRSRPSCGAWWLRRFTFAVFQLTTAQRHGKMIETVPFVKAKRRREEERQDTCFIAISLPSKRRAMSYLLILLLRRMAPWLAPGCLLGSLHAKVSRMAVAASGTRRTCSSKKCLGVAASALAKQSAESYESKLRSKRILPFIFRNARSCLWRCNRHVLCILCI